MSKCINSKPEQDSQCFLGHSEVKTRKVRGSAVVYDALIRHAHTMRLIKYTGDPSEARSVQTDPYFYNVMSFWIASRYAL